MQVEVDTVRVRQPVRFILHLILKVDDDSPAQKGGLMLGDILVGLDGNVVNDSEDLQTVLTNNRVGKTVPVEVIRGNTLHTLQITVGQRK